MASTAFERTRRRPSFSSADGGGGGPLNSTLGRGLERSQFVNGRTNMTTKDTIRAYFDSLKQKSGWETFLADGMAFTSFVTPIKQVMGKSAYLESTSRFFSMITAVEVKDLIVDGDRACALTRYQLQPPGGPAIESHVAEVFKVRNEEDLVS
jgi:predicted ester cyclase